MDDSGTRRRSTRKAAQERDMEFKQRLKQHRHKDMLFELMEDGTYEMREMSIREVFNYVQGGTGFSLYRVQGAGARSRHAQALFQSHKVLGCVYAKIGRISLIKLGVDNPVHCGQVVCQTRVRDSLQLA